MEYCISHFGREPIEPMSGRYRLERRCIICRYHARLRPNIADGHGDIGSSQGQRGMRGPCLSARTPHEGHQGAQMATTGTAKALHLCRVTKSLRNVRAGGLETALNDGDNVTILPAVAGGSAARAAG